MSFGLKFWDLSTRLYDRVGQTVQRLATGWTVRGSNPGGSEIFRTCPDRPWDPPSLLYKGTGSFQGIKRGGGVALTPHPLLVPWSRKSTATPALPLWAVLSSTDPQCLYKGEFTFTLYAQVMLQYSLYVAIAVVLSQDTHVYKLNCTRSFNVRTVTEVSAQSPSFDPRPLNAGYVVK